MNIDTNNNINGDGHVLDLIPEYIDKSLPADQRTAVRAHLESCATCRADYIELQATRFALKQMPVAAAPRSFAITEEVASRVKKPSFLESLFVPRLAPTFAGGSVVAFVLLVFLFATNNSIAPASPTAQTLNSYAKQQNDGARTGATDIVPGVNSQAMPIAPQVSSGTSVTEDPTTAMSASATSDTLPAPQTPEVATTLGSQVDGAGASDTISGVVSGGIDFPPLSVLTPNTTVSNSITSSPTTIDYPDQKSPGIGPNDGNTSASPPPSSTGATSALEIGLLALGVALATAAIIARRRTL